MKSRKELPAYKCLNLDINLNGLYEEYLDLYDKAKHNKKLIEYDHSGFFDLTFVDSKKDINDSSWVGVGRLYRKNEEGQDYLMNNLEYWKRNKPMVNDRNHNSIHEWAHNSKFIDIAKTLGDFSRLTLSFLKPGGWWPGHFDYDTKNAVKYHLPIMTNPDCFNTSWVSTSKEYRSVHMKEGELWFLNPGLKHCANNWGSKMRVHFVLTLKEQIEGLT